MQNRNMFLYRRQGPKKRVKSGPSRKNRGPQKGLPNSARDLLPLIQPATKALAQMLAGRTGASGQLGHARAILAQTERLVSDRAHNRLNPAEREEFFEQVARLKLTLADAESEAEVQALEEETPAPAPMPVNRERLKEMALALTSARAPTSYENRHANGADEDQPEPANDVAEEEASPVEEKPASDPNQLRLPRRSAEAVQIQPDSPRSRSNGRRRIAKAEAPSPRTATLKARSQSEPDPVSTVEVDTAENKAKVKASKSASALGQKLPKGWIIDDDGFVVPGPAT